MFGTDPLKIHYLVVLRTDRPKDTTAFQGFSISFQSVHWALHLLSTLPADVLERSHKIEDMIAQRMGDMRPLYWTPINANALEKLTTTDIGIFVVCFTGEQAAADKGTAKPVSALLSRS